MLIVVDVNLRDIAGHLGTNRDHMRLDECIVRGLVGPRMEVVAYAEREACQRNDEDEQETERPSIPGPGVVDRICLVTWRGRSTPRGGQWMGSLCAFHGSHGRYAPLQIQRTRPRVVKQPSCVWYHSARNCEKSLRGGTRPCCWLTPRLLLERLEFTAVARSLLEGLDVPRSRN